VQPAGIFEVSSEVSRPIKRRSTLHLLACCPHVAPNVGASPLAIQRSGVLGDRNRPLPAQCAFPMCSPHVCEALCPPPKLAPQSVAGPLFGPNLLAHSIGLPPYRPVPAYGPALASPFGRVYAEIDYPAPAVASFLLDPTRALSIGWKHECPLWCTGIDTERSLARKSFHSSRGSAVRCSGLAHQHPRSSRE